VEYLIRHYDLEEGALEIQYIEEWFGEFRRRKTAAEITRRLCDRDHIILMAEAPLPDDPGQVVEWVNLRVTGVGSKARPTLHPIAPSGDPLLGHRRVYFGDRRHDAPVYARERLSGKIDGPAVIQEFGSTLPIHPGFTARIDELGNVVVAR